MQNIRDYSFDRIKRGIKNRIFDIPETLSWLLPTKISTENKKEILKFKDIHKGERCFIVANGPSLKQTDLSLLKDEYTIGMNRIYLLEEVNGFIPSYLVVADIEIQLNQFRDEYNQVKVPKFFPWEVRNKFDHFNTYFYKMKYKTDFSPNFTGLIGAAKSVTVVCIQLAYFMGFQEVILIGKDHSYNHKQQGVPGTRLKSDGNENNHFIKGYYKPGMKWSIPNYIEEEISYQFARDYFEKNNRKILDATINGKLTVFEKIDYYSLFK
jgi:hypothetical protein